MKIGKFEVESSQNFLHCVIVNSLFNRALMCLRNAENGVVTLQLIRHKSTSNATPTTPITDGFLPSPVYPADSQPSVSHRPSRTFSHVPSSGDYEEIDRQGPAGMTKKSSR